MTSFDRGDVVIVDLGMIAKTRPCVVVSIPKPDPERNMAVVVPMTTEIRGGQCEVGFPKPAWLKQASVVNVLGVAGVETARIERRLTRFDAAAFAAVEVILARILGLKQLPSQAPA